MQCRKIFQKYLWLKIFKKLSGNSFPLFLIMEKNTKNDNVRNILQKIYPTFQHALGPFI